MKTYIVYMRNGGQQTIRGTSIADAIQRSNINPNHFAQIVSYEDNGRKIDIAGEAQCGCWYHAEDGLSCNHDLEKIGIAAATA